MGKFVKQVVSWVLVLVLLTGCLCVPVMADSIAPTLRTTEQGIQFIKSQEGFSANRMWDYSQYSIGYGTACGAGDYPNGITVEQADALLRNKLVEVEAYVNAFIEKNNLPFSESQYDALVSFTYNVGSSWMSGSRLSKLLVSGMFTEIEFASAIGVWCHAGSKVTTGLVLRRIREIQMFLYGDYAGTNSKKYYYLLFDADGGTMNADIYFYPEGSAYGPLQAAEKKDRKFLGWFIDTGVQLTEAATVSQNLTVKARWQTPRPANQAFSDVQQGSWFYTYVDELYNANVINGYTDGTFRPSGTVTVGEALKLLLLSCGSTVQSPTEGHWASGYRSLATEKAYLTAEETAQLDVPITRGLIAKLSAGAMGISAESREGIFADTGDGYVLALYNAKIITGTQEAGELYFYPDNFITRAELSAIVFRIRNR